MIFSRKKLHLGVALAALLGGAGPASAQAPGSAGPPPAADLGQLLAYESTPLDVKVVGVEKKGDVRIEDITFGSVAGNPPIQAYVVRPETTAGPFAGMLFVHWFAPPHPTSNRTQYLGEALSEDRPALLEVLLVPGDISETLYTFTRNVGTTPPPVG